MSLAFNSPYSHPNLWRQWPYLTEFVTTLQEKLPPEQYETVWQRGVDGDLVDLCREAITYIDEGVRRRL